MVVMSHYTSGVSRFSTTPVRTLRRPRFLSLIDQSVFDFVTDLGRMSKRQGAAHLGSNLPQEKRTLVRFLAAATLIYRSHGSMPPA